MIGAKTTSLIRPLPVWLALALLTLQRPGLASPPPHRPPEPVSWLELTLESQTREARGSKTGFQYDRPGTLPRFFRQRRIRVTHVDVDARYLCRPDDCPPIDVRYQVTDGAFDFDIQTYGDGPPQATLWSTRSVTGDEDCGDTVCTWAAWPDGDTLEVRGFDCKPRTPGATHSYYDPLATVSVEAPGLDWNITNRSHDPTLLSWDAHRLLGTPHTDENWEEISLHTEIEYVDEMSTTPELLARINALFEAEPWSAWHRVPVGVVRPPTFFENETEFAGRFLGDTATRSLLREETTFERREVRYRLSFQSRRDVLHEVRWLERTTSPDCAEDQRVERVERIEGTGDILYTQEYLLQVPDDQFGVAEVLITPPGEQAFTLTDVRTEPATLDLSRRFSVEASVGKIPLWYRDLIIAAVLPRDGFGDDDDEPPSLAEVGCSPPHPVPHWQGLLAEQMALLNTGPRMDPHRIDQDNRIFPVHWSLRPYEGRGLDLCTIDETTGVIVAFGQPGRVRVRATAVDFPQLFTETVLDITCGETCSDQLQPDRLTANGPEFGINLGRQGLSGSPISMTVTQPDPGRGFTRPSHWRVSGDSDATRAHTPPDGPWTLVGRQLGTRVEPDDTALVVRQAPMTLYPGNGPIESPLVEWRWETSPTTTADIIRFTRTEVDSGQAFTSEYQWVESDQGWSVDRGHGLELIRQRNHYQPDGIRVLDTTISHASPDGIPTIDRVKRQTFLTTAYGEFLTQEVLDPEGAALETRYRYVDPETNLRAAGRTESIQYPDGAWEAFHYHDDGRIRAALRPWSNLALDEAEEITADATVYDYTPVAPRDDGALFPDRPRRETRTVGGAFLLRVYHVYYLEDGEEIEILEVATEPDHTYGDPDNIRSLVARQPPGRLRLVVEPGEGTYPQDTRGPAAGRITRIEFPNRTLETHRYEQGRFLRDEEEPGLSTFVADRFLGTAERVITTRGTLDAPDGIPFQTLQFEQVFDGFGNLALDRTSVCTEPGRHETVAWTAYAYDPADLQSVTIRSSDGTHSRWTRDVCCAAGEEIDAMGIRRQVLLDGAGRRAGFLQAGLADTPGIPDGNERIEQYFDGNGALIEILEQAASGSRPPLRTQLDYDLAGRQTRVLDARIRETLRTYPRQGRDQALVLPGGGTATRSNRLDRLPEAVTGTAVTDRFLSYDVEPGRFAVQTRYGAPDSPLWARRIGDGLGRLTAMEQSRATGEVVRVHYQYNPEGQRTAIIHPETPPLLFEYDDLGRLFRMGLDIDPAEPPALDPGGRDSIAEFRRRFRREDTDGSWWAEQETWLYAEENDPTPTRVHTARTRLSGFPESVVAESILLDAYGNPTRRTVAFDRVTRAATITTTAPGSAEPAVQHYANGLLQWQRNPHGHAQSFAYGDFRRPTTLADSAINGDTILRYDDFARLTTIREPGPRTTQIEYDPATGWIRSILNPLGKTTYFTYSPRGQGLRRWGPTVLPVERTYDDLGRLKTQTTFRGGEGWSGPEWPEAATGPADTYQWHYDPADGDLTATVNPLGAVTSYDFDAAGRLRTRTWARDRNTGRVTRYRYDDYGRLSTIDYPDEVTPDIDIVRNRLGLITAVSDGAEQHTFHYDAGLMAVDELLSRTAGTHHLQRQREQPGDPVPGRPAGIDLDGRPSRFRYDARGRPEWTDFPSAAEQIGYLPDSGLPATHGLYVGGSRVLESAVGRDAYLRVHTFTNRFLHALADLSEQRYAFTPDDLGRRTSMTLPDGGLWTYRYDDQSQLVFAERSLSDHTSLPGTAREFRYDTAGNPAGRILNHDPTRRTTTQRPDARGYIVSREDPGYLDVLGTAPENAEVTVNLSPTTRFGPLFHAETDIRDENRATMTTVTAHAVLPDTSGGGEKVVHRSTGQVFAPENPEIFRYDADGNLLQDGRYDYEWDDENRLVAMTTRDDLPPELPRLQLFFRYDFLGRRIRKEVADLDPTTGIPTPRSSSTFLYDGWLLLREQQTDHDTTVTTTTDYFWGADLSGSRHGAAGIGGLTLATITSPDTTPITALFLYDGSGNVRELRNADTGDKLAHYEYAPFGQLLHAEGPLALHNPFRFSTKYFDAESGLYYFGHRYYNPTTHQWLSPDPLGLSTGPNPTTFVDNNPVNAVDPTGLAGYFFDGTGNDRNRRGGFTNVSRLEMAYIGTTFYLPGVGTGGALDRTLYGGFAGGGGKERLDLMYRDLVKTYNQGDTVIDIFGFSRGSAFARTFANMIAERGIPLYGTSQEYWDAKGNLRTCVRRIYPKIRFLGIFDTVASIGVPGNNINISFELGIPDSVEHVAHAISRDEMRGTFPLSSIHDSPHASNKPGRAEQQFRGVHSDVGGGYITNPEASFLPLAWMRDQGNSTVDGEMFGPLPEPIQAFLESESGVRDTVCIHDPRLDQFTGKPQLKYLMDWWKDFGDRKVYYMEGGE